MCSDIGNNFHKIQCSSKQVSSKIDVCTRCYDSICHTCQIREDFVYYDSSRESQRSELYVDEIYTCNVCDQTWMDLFNYCFNCGRIVCPNFREKHDECPKIYGLMKSDIIKRRRLGAVDMEIKQLKDNITRKEETLHEIWQKLSDSPLLLVLKDSKSVLISKIEEVVQTYFYDTELFRDQLLGMFDLLKQQSMSADSLIYNLAHIKTKLSFPIQFLQELTELESTLQKIGSGNAKIDPAESRNAFILNVKCNPVGVNTTVLKSLLGIEVGNVKQQGRSHTLPCKETKEQGSQWYKISKLEEAMKSKDERLKKLTSERETYKKQIYLMKRSRDAAKEKCSEIEKTLKEMITKHETELLEKDESKQHEIDELKNKILQLDEGLKQTQDEIACQAKIHQQKQMAIDLEYQDVVQDLHSKIKCLEKELEEKNRTIRKNENDFASSLNTKEESIGRYKEHLQQNAKLLDIQRLQIEGLQENVRLLENQRDNAFPRDGRTNKENQRIKEKLRRVKQMFDDWTKSCSSLNNMMAQELNWDDAWITKDVHQPDDETTMRSFRDIEESNNDERENCDEKDNRSTKIHVGDVSAEENTSKHITSITYNAAQIHVIQHSQVSLDSGCDVMSLFEDNQE